MTKPKEDILRGTLDLLVLKTLDTLGPLHGFGIARRIEQISGDLLYLNQGTLYPALLRLRESGDLSNEGMNRIMRELDLEESRLEI